VAVAAEVIRQVVEVVLVACSQVLLRLVLEHLTQLLLAQVAQVMLVLSIHLVQAVQIQRRLIFFLWVAAVAGHTTQGLH
jgi:hypothetical protein